MDVFGGSTSPGQAQSDSSDSAYAIWEKEGYSLSPKRQVSRLLAILTLEKTGIERLSEDRRWREWYDPCLLSSLPHLLCMCF